METLNIDLNELVTKEINDKISELEKTIATYREQLNEQWSINKKLEKKVEESIIANQLLDFLRNEFSKITSSKVDNGGWYDSKQKNQYMFIKNTLANIFGVKEEYNGWLSHRSDGTLRSYLAVNYYSNKEVVINLLKAIMPDHNSAVEFIKFFVMPFDYGKNEVLKYVKAPSYNTNGCIFGINQYWYEAREAQGGNMPHDLIMQNTQILKEDVFNELLETIRKRKTNWYYLFALPKYNKNISNDQIKQLGELLIDMKKNELDQENLKGFISDNILLLNNKTLDFLYSLINTDNQFSYLNWQRFPVEYQMRFLKAKTFEEVYKILTNYDCKWTIQQKEDFLKQLFS